MAEKIQMKIPLVEMDGDEMTRILWKWVKEKLLQPYVDLKTEYYDLHIKKRDETDYQIVYDAAEAIKKYGVGVKCATITPNKKRVEEYNLKKEWPSPNGIIRAILDGTVFRKPIMTRNIKPFVRTWIKPIIIGRHAYGDVYKNQEIKTTKPGKAEIIFTSEDGEVIKKTIIDMKGPGIIQGIHNLDESIRNFARACFIYGLSEKVNVWFAAKDTISKTYDTNFKDIFEEVFENEYKEKFKEAEIEYFYTLIDDAVARVVKSTGGFLWALKNYDGDVMSDFIASAFGSLAMMKSVLVSPHGYFEYEAAHGTVQRHYYKHLKGEKTSTNSMALIFAWAGALRKRGELDNIKELQDFANKLEQASIDTVEQGKMTGDLAKLAVPQPDKILTSEEFLDAIKENLDKLMNK